MNLEAAAMWLQDSSDAIPLDTLAPGEEEGEVLTPQTAGPEEAGEL